MIQHEITACFGRKIDAERLVVGYEDSGVAFLVRLVTMEKTNAWQEEAKPYTIPEGTTARMNVTRPDRVVCRTEATIDGLDAVLCPIDPVACTKPGICTATVSLYSADGKRITTVSWEFEVPQHCGMEIPGAGNQYVDTLVELIKRAEAAAERAEKAAGAVGGQTTPGTAHRMSWVDEIDLLADKWVEIQLPGSGDGWAQTVSIDGVSENHQVDLTPNAEQVAIFYDKSIAFLAENEGGVVVVKAIGQKPENDYTIQVTITEVDMGET